MKNCFLLTGFAVLSLGMAMVSCSSTDVYDENFAKNAADNQRIGKYEEAFTQAFGQVNKNHQWGFDMTTGITTREAVNVSSESWVVPDNFLGGSKNKEGWNANEIEAAFAGTGKIKNADNIEGVISSTLPDFDFSNYFLQHVEKVGDGQLKQRIVQLYAYNSNGNGGNGSWEAVTNFSGGDNPNGKFELVNVETTYLYVPINKALHGATLMKDMGGDADANNKMFLLKMKKSKHSTTTYDYYDYKFFTFPAYHKEDGTRVEAEHFLVFRFPDEGTHWVIRLGEAKTAKKTISAEGRVLCEDMGANDFDFNDVVFDAYIMLNGDIQIEILAHGGELDIAVADRLVTLDKMSNTGQKTVNTQKFTITNQERQEKGWNSIASIPVVVYPKGFTADDKGSKADDLDNESFPLEANTGKVPQKVCAPVGTKWPDEFIRISNAYTSFGTWVSEIDPARWTFQTRPRLVNLNLTDNSNPEQD